MRVKPWQIAFCPWIEMGAAPFEICGVQVIGFQQLCEKLTKQKQAALRRARTPYYEHFLGRRRQLRSGNDNPLAFIVDQNNPLREYSAAEVKRVFLANAYLYLCSFALNTTGLWNHGEYTSWSDWALYIHNIRDPRWYALQPRKLYGDVLSGGHEWKQTVISRPVECNRFVLRKIRQDMIAAVNELHKQGKTNLFYHAIKTFAEGTSDREAWLREEDLPFIKDAIEQMSQPLQTNANFLKGETKAASQTGLKRGLINFVRAVAGQKPAGGMICKLAFHPKQDGSQSKVTEMQKTGKEFSWLERCVDDLNMARNMVTHVGFVDGNKMGWPTMSLAFVGSRFFVACFKRMLEWEAGFKFLEKDDADVFALGYLAKYSRKNLLRGFGAYRRAHKRCLDMKIRDTVLEELEKMEAKQKTAGRQVAPKEN